MKLLLSITSLLALFGAQSSFAKVPTGYLYACTTQLNVGHYAYRINHLQAKLKPGTEGDLNSAVMQMTYDTRILMCDKDETNQQYGVSYKVQPLLRGHSYMFHDYFEGEDYPAELDSLAFRPKFSVNTEYLSDQDGPYYHETLEIPFRKLFNASEMEKLATDGALAKEVAIFLSGDNYYQNNVAGYRVDILFLQNPTNQTTEEWKIMLQP